MADWMRDTIDAAEYMAGQLEGARAAPRIVAQKLHAYALGVTDETGSLLARLRESGDPARAVAPDGLRSGPAGGAGGAGATNPPPCNTGGKVPKNTGKPKGGKSS
jgi:hypothetical protein